jgi:hypothetical protein
MEASVYPSHPSRSNDSLEADRERTIYAFTPPLSVNFGIRLSECQDCLFRQTASVETMSMNPLAETILFVDICIAYVCRQDLIHRNHITLNVRAEPIVVVKPMFRGNHNTGHCFEL